MDWCITRHAICRYQDHVHPVGEREARAAILKALEHGVLTYSEDDDRGLLVEGCGLVLAIDDHDGRTVKTLWPEGAPNVRRGVDQDRKDTRWLARQKVGGRCGRRARRRAV